MVAMKSWFTESSSRHPMSLACSSMDDGRPPVRAASISSGSSPMQASSSSDRLERTASWSVGGREECSPWGTGVGRGVDVATGVGVFGINAGVAATVPAAGVSVGSRVGIAAVQAIRAARMIRSREVMGEGFRHCRKPSILGSPT